MYRFLIADDHAIVRKGLLQLIKEEFPDAYCCEAADGHTVIKKVREEKWNIILLDISMPERSGMEVLRQLKSEGNSTPVLMLSIHPEEQYALRVFKAGASGFLTKASANDELIKAVHQLLLGKKYISQEAADILVSASSKDNKKELYENLSNREMEVLLLIASGKTLSEIADELSLSINTISTYRSRILEKLGLNNNAELMRYAIDNQLA
ncbi:MAG TPA: response regulator transcription factor [Chitinophagales bacterium]|nr:response regulator transcription factor [Chitinophagales bacterium]